MKKDKNLMILLLLSILDVFSISTHVQDTETSDITDCNYNMTGKFPLCDLCQEYYVCKYEEDLTDKPPFVLELHSCPFTMIFSTSERECIESSQTIKKYMLHIGNASKEVWSLVKTIDSYEEIILSTLPLLNNFDYHKRFDTYVTVYNRNLQAVKTDMRTWRSRDCIVGNIQLLFTKVKEYGIEFDGMINICKNLMSNYKNKSPEVLQILLEAQNARKGAIHTKTKQIDTFPAVNKQPYKIQVIHPQEHTEEISEEIKKNSSASFELKQLVMCLGLAKNIPSKLVELATNTTEQLWQLKNDFLMHNATFSETAKSVKSDLLTLEMTLKQLKIEKERNENSITKLDEGKKRIIQALQNHQKKFAEISNKITGLNLPSTRHMSAFEKAEVYLRNIFNIFSKNSYLYSMVQVFDPSMESKQHEYKMQSEQEEMMINRLTYQLRVINIEKTHLRETESTTNMEIRDTKSGIREFTLFLPEVSQLAESIESVMRELKEVAQKIEFMENTFFLLKNDIRNMLKRANQAKGDDEKQNATEEIMKALESHKSAVDQTSKQICDVKEC